MCRYFMVVIEHHADSVSYKNLFFKIINTEIDACKT